MIRKRIAIFFVLFATALLLVHAVVPHHHHKDHICLSANHCQSDDHAHQHNAPLNDHRHDGQSDSEFCVLKQAVFIPSTQENQLDKYWHGNDKPFSLLDFQAIVFDNEWKSTLPGSVLPGREFILPFVAYNFTDSSCGLRAPPVA
ncbi:MAG TPA: DUF6769 family protein [Prolixibacteraceae bacterium]|nr:DUF6769 family protein [Prolixibacteraceae bacterium]